MFIFVIDHGSRDNYTTYINLWGNETISDSELQGFLAPITFKPVNVNVVLGQCFSGGFILKLSAIDCSVVSTASAANEFSWSCPDIPYDEFVYHWTCAINKANHLGTPVLSDTDNNGRVTMDEAFEYARNNDRMSQEHPKYHTSHRYLGEDLAFNNIPEQADLYIKDNSGKCAS